MLNSYFLHIYDVDVAVDVDVDCSPTWDEWIVGKFKVLSKMKQLCYTWGHIKII